MDTGMIPKKLIKSKVFVNNAGRNFMTIHAIPNEGSFVPENVQTLHKKGLRRGFVRIAKNRLRFLRQWSTFAVLWNAEMQDQEQRRGRLGRKFSGNAYNAVKSFGEHHQLLKSLVVNSVLVIARLSLKNCLIKQIRAFMAQVFGCRLVSAFSNGTIILAKSADLEENISMSIIRNINEMVERKMTKISLPYALIAIG